MRRGFTLVEVLIAVVIVSIAGIALLKMNSANLFFFTKLKNYAQMQEVLAIAGLHGSNMYKRDDKSLYDILEPHYTIDNDDLRKYLDSQTYRYDESVVDTISLDSSTLSGDSAEQNATDDIGGGTTQQVQFQLVKIVLRNKQNHGSILQLRSFVQ